MVRDLKKFFPYYLGFVEQYVVGEICRRHGLEPFDALQRFLNSETYRMVSNFELAMWEFSHPAIVSMWECEQITGDPRNSIYIRSE